MNPPTAIDGWNLGRILADMPLNGELDLSSATVKPMAEHLASLPFADRAGAFRAMMAVPGIDHQAISLVIANAQPTGPAPAAPTNQPFRSAHLGDLAANAAANRFVWKNRIVRGHFNLLSSDPKVGKTHVMLDLARRIYFEEPWPDGQDPTFPQGSKTLWVCGDRHQDELRERAHAFGLPDDAVRLNAPESNPYGGWDLDEPDNIDLLRRIVEAEGPALVIIDTVWRATRRQLRREEELNALLDPIISIAQDTDTAFQGLMHLSKDGETLGRRIEGLARSIMKLTRPDPDGQPDRRRLQVTGNFKEPPVMGLTMKDNGCDWDFNPPSAPAGSKGGRPPEKLDKAITFLEAELSAGDRKAVEIITAWQAEGENKGTLFNARAAMVADGRLVVDDTAKPQIWHLVKNPP
jgi:hypothetical protein